MARPLALEAGGHYGGGAVHRAHQQGEGIEVRGLQIQRGQLKVEVDGAHQEGNDQIDRHPGGGAFDRLSWFFLFLRTLGGCSAFEAFPLEAAGVAA